MQTIDYGKCPGCGKPVLDEGGSIRGVYWHFECREKAGSVSSGKLSKEDVEWLGLVSQYLRKLADYEPRTLFNYIRSDGRIDVSEERVRRELSKE